MIIRLALLLCLINSLAIQASDNALLGCPDLNSMAKALSMLERSNWRKISLAQVQALWPFHLDGLDCDEKACTSVWYKGRIIDNHCECCTTFFFEKEQIRDEPSGFLASIVINHSGLSREKALDATKILCEVLGLPQKHIILLGSESMQNFSWESVREQQRELTGLNVRISRNKLLWEININISRSIIE